MAKAAILDKVKLDYDEEGDVLYISFGRPQAADDSEITDEGVVIRLRAGKIVGVSILNARKQLVT
jgi:uncharacterized protein YuzE